MIPDSRAGTINWVRARAACSRHQVFKDLSNGAKSDVDDVNELREFAKSETTFSISVTSSKYFSVIRVDDPMLSTGRSVDFELGANGIVVRTVNEKDSRELFVIDVTLNNEGVCRLTISGKEGDFEQWQVRKMALDKLFFG